MEGGTFAVGSTPTNFEEQLEDLCHSLEQFSFSRNQIEGCLGVVFSESNGSNFDVKKSLPSTVICWLCYGCCHVVSFAKMCLQAVILFVLLYLFAMSHNSVQKFIMRNSQGFIYPFMRTLRLWTLPVIQTYEVLTDFHEEDCLFQNPFYREPLLDCWPCEDVKTLVDLSSLHNYSCAYVNNEKPFVVRDVMLNNFTMENLQTLYRENELTLHRGTAKFSSSHGSLDNISSILDEGIFKELGPNFHISWKINRVAAARVIRKIFRRPYFIPNTTEVALQRFLFISGPDAPQFYFPVTEFANVWVAQGQGHRLVVLDPSESCWQNCSTVSILLRPQDVLYYNWQFWRPRSFPARLSKDLSITYVGSFY